VIPIQFIRYAPRIVGRGGVVVVECQQALVELFQSANGVSEVVAAGGPLAAVRLSTCRCSACRWFSKQRWRRFRVTVHSPHRRPGAVRSLASKVSAIDLD